MERVERYTDHSCFFTCAVCVGASGCVDTFYMCLSCPQSPFTHLCESCYLEDRRGTHRSCDDFDATFPKPTPSSWLSTPTPPALEKDQVPSVPPRFLLRCVVRSATKEAILGHSFVVGSTLYSALHVLDPLGKTESREVSAFDLMGGELGAWMSRPLSAVTINPVATMKSPQQDVVKFEVVSGKWDNGVRLADRRPSAGETVYVMSSVGVFSCVLLPLDDTFGPDDVVLLCSRSPSRDLLLSGSPLLDSQGRVFGLLVTGGTLPPNRRVYGGAFVV